MMRQEFSELISRNRRKMLKMYILQERSIWIRAPCCTLKIWVKYGQSQMLG